MKTVFDHIDLVKEKPHHIRKRVAFSVAGAGTALIALVWLVGSASLGKFAIAGSSFADSVGQEGVIVTNSDGTSKRNLAGAAASLESLAAPHIEIVDTATSSSKKVKAEQTIIPF